MCAVCCVTEGWPGQNCFNEAGSICLPGSGLICSKDMYELSSERETSCEVGLMVEYEGAILPLVEEKKKVTAAKILSISLCIFDCFQSQISFISVM